MKIYTQQIKNNTFPEGFDALLLTLDAGLKSSLEWHHSIEEAKRLIALGYQIFWTLDLGSIDDPSHLEILKHSVEHFNEVIWKEFSGSTVGVSLYQGSYSLSDEKVEFLDYLAAELADEVVTFLLLDATESPNVIVEAQLTSKVRFPHFTLAIKGGKVPCESFRWKVDHLDSVHHECSIGISIPEEGGSDQLLNILNRLQEIKKPYKVIPESLLTSEWHGLDYVIVDPETLSVMGRRKLMGFCAAGGTVVSLGEKMDLPLEKSGEEFFSA